MLIFKLNNWVIIFPKYKVGKADFKYQCLIGIYAKKYAKKCKKFLQF